MPRRPLIRVRLFMRQRLSKTKTWIAITLVLLGAVLVFAVRKERASAGEFFTAPVDMGSLRTSVNATGAVQTVVTVQVGSQISGQQPGQTDDFLVRSLTDVAQASAQVTTLMTILLGSIAAISLIVGGIGIMNIMLVSVTERTREIGIRMAVGARPNYIRLQFLAESLMLSLMGGLIGILIGGSISKGISGVLGWPTLVSSLSVLISFGFATAIGIFFGYYPAHKAAALDPIDALRYE